MGRAAGRKKRFLVLEVEGKEKNYSFEVRTRSDELELPQKTSLLHFLPGDAVGFNSVLTVEFDQAVEGRLVGADGFFPLDAEKADEAERFQSTTGGRLQFSVARSGSLAAPVELRNALLSGKANEKKEHVVFVLTGTAQVSDLEESLPVLQGKIAVGRAPEGAGYRLVLISEPGKSPEYRLEFDRTGEMPIRIEFAASLRDEREWTGFDFRMPVGTVVPVELIGIPGKSEFQPEATVVPSADGEAWRGFLPSDGRCQVAWKRERKPGEGKLFFTSSAMIDVAVGAGLLRQSTEINFKILQGELEQIRLKLDGLGEILQVDGRDILGWTVREAGGERLLEVKLSRPIEADSSLKVGSQTALEAFPARVMPLRLTPEGAVRHAGYIRIYNSGAVRVEVADPKGLIQLSPEQYPAKAF